MVIGEICFISGLHCQKNMILIGSNMIVLRVRREDGGKAKNLAIFTDFSIKGEICLKRKGGGVSSWLIVKQCKKKGYKTVKMT